MSQSDAGHWDTVYERTDETSVSWYQPVPTRSLAILDELGVDSSRSVVDIGSSLSAGR